MKKLQHNDPIIFNKNMPWFPIFCFCGILYLGINNSLWCFIFLLILPISFKKIKPNVIQILMTISIVIGFWALCILNPKFNLISHINELIKIITRNKITNSMYDFLDKKYNQELSSFIKLILFNIKSSETYIFYKQVINLGIVWLICISGFHISLIVRINKLIFKSKPLAGLCVNWIIVFFYMIFLKIPYGALRIFLTLFFTHFFKRFKIYGFDKLGFIGLCICLLNPCCFASYGFLLSFIVCMTANYLNKFDINNKFIKSLFGSFLFYLVTIPFMFNMNNKISIFTFINTFVLNYLLTGYFLYFIVFAWLPFMQPIHTFLMQTMYVIIGNISFTNIYIYSKQWATWIKFLYYCMFIIFIKITYLIVKHNKV